MNYSVSYIVTSIMGILSISRINPSKLSYNLYYTDTPTTDRSYHCLYFTTYDEEFDFEKMSEIDQITEYCFRVSSMEEDILMENSVSSVLTFNQLKNDNITVENLIDWSAPIDLIERYGNFLHINQSSSSERFYNCTEPWFGPVCQYKFTMNLSFYSIVRVYFYWKELNIYSNFTCYTYIKCKHGSPVTCLDWRNICDGKTDCLIDGEDEQNCTELEMNQCNDNEYQCRNGMCVDEAFVLDRVPGLMGAECLDGSDEDMLLPGELCSEVPAFRCEEYATYFTKLSCGNGDTYKSLLPRSSYLCLNKRDEMFNYIIDWYTNEDIRFTRCFKMLLCSRDDETTTKFKRHCKYFCENEAKCEQQVLHSCPSAFISPTYPVWDGHVRLGYFSNQSVPFRHKTKIVPQFICYDKNRCPSLIPTFTLENFTCLHLDRGYWLETDLRNFYSMFATCTRFYQIGNETQCRERNMSHCVGTNKCIPKNWIMDGIPDCHDAFDESLVVNSCALNNKNRFNCTSENRCLLHYLVGDNVRHCIGGEDETGRDYIVKDIQKLPFSAICNNWIDLISLTNETDETNCEQ